MLDELHKKKIEMSDEIFVIDVGKYIGESTQSEIEYATELGKPIHYYSDWSLQQNLERLETYPEYRAKYPNLIKPMKPHLKEQIKKILPEFPRQPILSFVPDGTVQFRWELKRYEGTKKTDILVFTFDGSDRIKIVSERYANNNRKPKPIYSFEDVYNIFSLSEMVDMVKDFYNKSTEEVLAEKEEEEEKK